MPKCTEVKFTVRQVLRQYEHEEITATYTREPDDELTDEEMLVYAMKMTYKGSKKFRDDLKELKQKIGGTGE